MALPSLPELRQRLRSLSGFVPATLLPPASQGRDDQATISPARLIEPGPVTARAVGAPAVWPGPVAFLDGTQSVDVICYVGTSRLVHADVAAAVRERVGREARTVVEERLRLVVARPEVLAAAGPMLDGFTTVAIEDDEPVHPLRDLDAALSLVDHAREDLERKLGDSYRRWSPHWLIVDGSLADSVGWARVPRMIGVSKSHARLPFEGDDLITYLQLPAGHRSSVFQPSSHRQARVYAWGLRLWPWAERDLLYGLVRVEAAPGDATLAMVDQISRWLLAERSPISAPDPRWDRLLYGIRGVEEYLKAARGAR